MKLRLLLLAIAFLSLWSIALSQLDFPAGEIVDERDGKIYQTIEIGNLIWLTENMKYETENAVMIVKDDHGIHIDGYYYPFDETDKICPNEFRIPEENEWEEYLEVLFELKNIPKGSIEFIDFKNRKFKGRGMEEAYEGINFFEEPNPLKLAVSGIIQGGKFIDDEALSFWTRKSGTEDLKYHVHLDSNTAWNHTHKHHIDARKRKKRKFVVRCVKSD